MPRSLDPIIRRIPLEDMRELWVWGSWKEPVPVGFSSTVFIVCTSRAAGRRYAKERTSDTWLLADELGEEAEKQPPALGDDALFISDPADSLSGKAFRLLTFKHFVKELQREWSNATKARRGITLLVNPRKAKGGIEADAIYSAGDYLARASEPF